jgi:hypothetical protein
MLSITRERLVAVQKCLRKFLSSKSFDGVASDRQNLHQ